MKNKCRLVLQTSNYVIRNSDGHVRINSNQIATISDIKTIHYTQFPYHQIPLSDQEVINYIFVLTGANFCFWPKQNMEYDFLASSIKQGLLNGYLTIQNLVSITQQDLAKKVFKAEDIPLVDQRARILREIGITIKQKFDGKFVNIVIAAQKSAVKLVSLITQNFENFQDHTIYKGHQIHFYKRAQLLVADIWRHFKGTHLGEFVDIQELTMFADYRVPQILKQWGILEYSQELQNKINNKQLIQSGSKYEVEIRAYSVIATQKIKQHLLTKFGKKYASIDIDEFLWQQGQKRIKQLGPHHRTLGIYY